MAEFVVTTKGITAESEAIKENSGKLKKKGQELDSIKNDIAKNGSYWDVSASLEEIMKDVLNEAATAKTMGEALAQIAKAYENAETKIVSFKMSNTSNSDKGSDDGTEEGTGTDKRNWVQRLVDWILGNDPDSYDATSTDQEKAADLAMKKELNEILQDEKYSQENWDKSTVEERKQILQDYMDEVVKVYGLENVKPNIVWDPNATYEEGRIKWGYYSHGKHTVTLNEQALSDSKGSWDSYDLLETVSHELRHAYQHEAIDRPTDFEVTKETIDTWDNNFDNYIKPEDNHTKYLAQPVEVDARDFQVTRDDTY